MIHALFLLAALVLPGVATAQTWTPTRPIEVIVPFTAGSLADRNIRTAAPLLTRELGVPVVVQNLPGATGYNRIYRAAPDGATLGVGDPVAQMGLALVQPQPFDILRLTWLGHWSAGTQTMVLSARSRFQSLDQMRGAAQPVRCGTFGGVSTGAMQCALLGRALGFQVAFVTLAGPPELVLANVRGDVDVASLGPSLWTDHIAQNSVRPILSWDATRDDRLPDVPALGDLGLQRFAPVTVLRSVAAPPNLPAAIRDRLIAALNKVVASPEWDAFVTQSRLERNWVFAADYPASLEAAKVLLEENAAALRAAF
ncbi:tripartite tricarboxylate transporter substrate binding protein [Humitalea sp. 24SJ18S-53]|uniref:tripartite tricarboxylate transporter substrate binding protein n=1 Tax=Humitalea sp. 24SJ18S-53 TaxID=3422307 RepID=UPI003D66995E